MAFNNSIEDEQFQHYLGEYTGLDEDCGEIVSLVRQVRDNSYELDELRLYYDDTDCFTNHAWLLLGRYIAKNTFLERLELSNCNLNDEKIASLFRELTSSSSLQRLDLGDNQFGIDGLRCILPFIESSSMLSSISFHISNSFDNECFDILVRTLHGKKVAKLSVGWCNIIDISVLETYNLPKLRDVLLNGNIIGREGFIIISNLLQKENTTLRSLSLMETGMGDEEAEIHLAYNYVNNEGCEVISKLLKKKETSLKFLDLSQNEIDDEGAEILATSLKHNITLTALRLSENDISQDVGFRPFLKMLNDISSIENTYKNSNHTLKELVLVPPSRPPVEGDGDDETNNPPLESSAENSSMHQHIQSAIQLNVRHGPHQYSPGHSRIKMNAEHFNAVGKAKIIHTQLNSATRNELSVLQDTPSNLFYSEDDDVLLPEVLALVGNSHGHTELYRMLLATVPALVSIMNREMKVRDVMDLPYTMDR